MGVEDDELVQRLRANKSRGTGLLNLVPPIEHDRDLIPEIETTTYERTEDDLAIDGVLSRVDILDAYTRWCGKMQPKVGMKRESVMISCPLPSHPDANPSAWVNLDKQTWYCGACQQGGDKFDIAAWHFGYDVPGYKGRDFPALRRDMAESLGYVVQRTLGGQEYLVDPTDTGEQTVPVVSPQPQAETANGQVIGGEDKPPSVIGPSENLAEVVTFPGVDLESDVEKWDARLQAEMSEVAIDWESLVKPDTFLWEWMESCTIDDLPHEYYFWLGMQAIAFAAGTDVLMDDYRKIKANLNVVLYGRTGSGKSRAIEPFARLIRDALPWDGDDYTPSSGVQLLPSPASAEALLRMFQHEIKDPSSMATIKRAQVRGLLRVEEFASFVARASRPTNPMKETLIELFDVLDHTIKHTSVTGGTVQAHNPFAQMVTSTQPKAIHSFLKRTDAESGFMNRWVFATGQRRRDRISYGGVSIDIDGAATILKAIRAWCSTGHTFRLDGQALQVWDDFFHAEIVPLHDTTDESMLSRIDLILKKLIILFTINEKEPQPTADTVSKAIALFPYLRRTALMFSTDIAFSDFEACRTQVHDVVGRTGDKGITMRLLSRGLDAKFERPMVLQVIKTMIDLGEIQEIVLKGKRGPTSTRYVVGE